MPSRTLTALAAILLLTAAFSLCTRAEGRAFSYAQIHASCAPWDGPAVELTLTKEQATCKRGAYPNMRIYIWRNLPTTAPTTIHFDNRTDNGGASLCTSENSCQRAVKGSITFKTLEQGKHASGGYEFEFPDGSIEKGSFDADWCTDRVICG